MIWWCILLGVGGLLFRFIPSRDRRQIWWICGTLAPATMVLSMLILAVRHSFDQLLDTPNLSYLISGLLTTIGAGCSQVLWHSVRNKTPKTSLMWAHGALALLMGVATMVMWQIAPIHTQEAPSLYELPQLEGFVIPVLLIQTYFIFVNLNVALGAYELLAPASISHPDARPALWMGVIAGTSVTLAQIIYTARMAFLDRPLGQWMLVSGGVLVLVAVAGFGLSGMLIVGLPPLLREIRANRIVRELLPLWKRAGELQPGVVLRGRSLLLYRPTLRKQRMMIEIGDALRVLGVSEKVASLEGVAAAFVAPEREHAVPASSVLSAMGLQTAEHEEALFIQLSRAYQRARAGFQGFTSPAWSR